MKKKADFVCTMCHNDAVHPSKVMLQCNYGSRNAGKTVTVEICDKCADKLYEKVLEITGEKIAREE